MSMKSGFLKKKWSSLIEVIIIVFIISSWLIWAYRVLWNSQNFINSTKNVTIASQIASQAIESFANIRDTNVLIFRSDKENCRNTLNYNLLCVWNSWYKINPWNYIITRNLDQKFILEEVPPAISSLWFNDENYRNTFAVKLDSDWFFTQKNWTDYSPFFSLKNNISYYIDSAQTLPWNELSPYLKLVSTVEWVDKNWEKKSLELDQIFTNYK